MNKALLALIMFLFLSAFAALAQEGVNYDEAKTGEYTLPEVLKMENGKSVRNKLQWERNRRPEVLNLFKENVYGQFPGKPEAIHFKVQRIDSNSISGTAISKQVRIFFTKGDNGPYVDVIIFTPRNIKKPVPVFVGLNFRGNQSVSADESIEISQNYLKLLKIKRANTDSIKRGELAGRWEIEFLIKRGYGLATAYYGDLEHDHSEGWKTGLRNNLQNELRTSPANWSAIGVWAWSLSRMMDYLETDKNIDATKVTLVGHSRLGKAALWAGANDTRFAAVISNNSGEGGATLARRWYGETTKIITEAFPHWFINKYKIYTDKIGSLPVDQHMLLSLIAPRPLYVASATNDQWADPKGEFLSVKHAEPVYSLFKKKGLGVDEIPPADFPVGNTISYHIRTGKHDIVLYDWLQYLDFTDRQLNYSRELSLPKF